MWDKIGPVLDLMSDGTESCSISTWMCYQKHPQKHIPIHGKSCHKMHMDTSILKFVSGSNELMGECKGCIHISDTHYDDVIMTMLASQITSLTVVYSIVYSGVNQRKHQSSASLAFVREIHRGPVNFPHKWPVTRKMFPFDDHHHGFFPTQCWQKCGGD